MNEEKVLFNDVENKDDYKGKEEIILEQSPIFDEKNKTLLEEGDTITLYIPNIVNEYPDMVAEGWTLNEVIAFAEIGDFLYQPVKKYSSGMKSRLGFAINVNIKPEILIVDEALSVGDAAFKNKCKEKVNEIINNENVTLLFVTHQTAVAEEFCKRGVVMKDGKLVFDGEVAEASKKYDELYKKKKKK